MDEELLMVLIYIAGILWLILAAMLARYVTTTASAYTAIVIATIGLAHIVIALIPVIAANN